jgi:hypothetical protein
MVQLAQSAMEIALVKEAYGTRVYDVDALDVPLFGRSERLRIWVRATETVVSCFAVELSLDGGRTFINPLNLLP